MKKIVVVVNKSWEYEPFYNALTNPKLRPETLPLPNIVNPVPTDRVMSEPRAEITTMKNIHVVFRCVENMMDPDVNKSNSQEKMVYMPGILQADAADLVISVSTAESTPEAQGSTSTEEKSINGSVLMGESYFMFDGREYDLDSDSELKVTKEFSSDGNCDFIYPLITDEFSDRCLKKFLTAKNSPSEKMLCHAYYSLASIGVINIINYEAYAKGDPAAYDSFKKSQYATDYTPVCIETTHGIVNMAANQSDTSGNSVPVFFVSPITDRYTHFDEDVTDIQNYICGFNAGITVAELLVELNAYFADKS